MFYKEKTRGVECPSEEPLCAFPCMAFLMGGRRAPPAPRSRVLRGAVETRHPSMGKSRFFQWILRKSKSAVKREGSMLSMVESTFASVCKSECGRKIMVKMPKPKPVTLWI